MSNELEQLNSAMSANHKCFDCPEKLLEAVDVAVAASVVLPERGNTWVIAVAKDEDDIKYLTGEGEYGPALQKLIDRFGEMNIGTDRIPTWPPCKIPIFCEPELIVRRQLHLNRMLNLHAQFARGPQKLEE